MKLLYRNVLEKIELEVFQYQTQLFPCISNILPTETQNTETRKVIVITEYVWLKKLSLFSFATKTESPQWHMLITVGPYYVTSHVTFPVRGNRCTRINTRLSAGLRFILFSQKDWARVTLKTPY